MKKSFKMKISYILGFLAPLKKDTIFFQSFGGQYNDNPKYISEYLHEHYPNYKLVWGIDEKKCNISDIPKYIKIVKMNSIEYYKYAVRSKVVVENMNGIVGFVSEKSRKILPKLFKRKNQLNISTWHGIPLKYIGLDEIKDKNKDIKYIYTSSDYISSGSSYSYEIFKKSFYPTKIKNNGSPRVDILFEKNNDNLKNLKLKLGIPYYKKVVLYAPTFRNTAKESGIVQLNEMDIPRLLECLKNRFGGEWCFVFRAHHVVLTEVKLEKLDDNIILGFDHDDMNEYMAITDVLITDYSGCMFDYMLTKRPCFLYTNDKKDYIMNNRKLYFDMKTLPYESVCTPDELYRAITNYKHNEKIIESFLNKIGNNEDGKSSKIISDEIDRFMKGEYNDN